MRLAPSLLAAFVAPARIFTKNGFVASFVISPTLIVAACDVGFADAAATSTDVPTTAARRAVATTGVRQDVCSLCGSRIWYLHLPLPVIVVPITRLLDESQAMWGGSRIAGALMCVIATKNPERPRNQST